MPTDQSKLIQAEGHQPSQYRVRAALYRAETTEQKKSVMKRFYEVLRSPFRKGK